MLCNDIINRMEDTYPRKSAEEWDNVGLLVGRADKEIQRIYVALDATDEVIEEAIRQKADLLLTHHPLLFTPVSQITGDDFIGRRILKLAKHDISYYAMHTNYDVIRMAALAGEILGLRETEVMHITDEETGEGIGRVGKFERKVTVKECCELVKEKFQLAAVKVYGDLDAVADLIAISPGSGKHMSDFAISKGAKAFVTAEIDHHEALDANARGMAIIDAGHYGLEHIFIKDMLDFFNKNTQGIEIIGAKVKHPYCVI